MSKDVFDKLRGMVRRVTVKSVKDDGQMQTATVEVAEGITREDVEILQPYGMSSMADTDGALALALAVGGDEGDMVLLPIGNPAQRMGGLGIGDVGLYNAGGDKVILRAGGGIEISAAASITLKVGGVTVTISGAGLAIEGGTVTHNGVDIGDTHKHRGVLPGSGITDVPVGG